MWGLFKKKSKKDILLKKYKALTEEAFKLSHTNRKLSDEKAAAADLVLKEIESIEATENQ